MVELSAKFATIVEEVFGSVRTRSVSPAATSTVPLTFAAAAGAARMPVNESAASRTAASLEPSRRDEAGEDRSVSDAEFMVMRPS